jgi:hypothetical protein
MRNRNAIAQPGRAKFFPAGDGLEDFGLRVTGQFCRTGSKVFKQLAFCFHAGATKHRALSQDIGQFHSIRLGSTTLEGGVGAPQLAPRAGSIQPILPSERR